MNLKLAFFGLLALLFSLNVFADEKICWYEPVEATQEQQITVWFDATKGNAALSDYRGEVYAHAGVLTEESSGTSDWKHAPAWCDNSEKYRLSRSASNTNLYSLTLTPSDYFSLLDNESVCSLVFVMRSADGGLQGKTSSNGDIVVPWINKKKPVGYEELGAYRSHKVNDSQVEIAAEGGRLQITAYNDYIFKVLQINNNVKAEERRSITVSASPCGSVAVQDSGDRIVISTGKCSAVVLKSNCSVQFTNQDGLLMLAEAEGLNNSMESKSCRFAPMNDVAFYGGGYNGQRTDQSDYTLVMNNTQTGNWENGTPPPHNICIPFFVSTSGYGILFDDHYRGAKLTPSPLGTAYSTNSPTPVAYYFIGGTGTMASVLENYTFLTGRQELPPYWALGYFTSRYGYRTRAEAEQTVRDIKNAQLPLDAIVFDLYWQGQDNSGMGCLDWYAPNWNNPVEMMAEFKKQGINTICITEPFFTSKSSNYASLKQMGYFADDNVSGMEWLQSPQVGLIDASNPDAMNWMWQFYKKRTAEGVSGWWLDLGEPERHDDDSRHMEGSVAQIHNEFGDLWVERVYRGLKEDFPSQRRFIMPRAGTAGMQRHSTFPWTGDIRRSWGGLKAQVPALVSMGMSGVGYTGSDVGGFSANHTDEQLYLRWVQFSVFSPMMRTHSSINPEPTQPCYSNILTSVRKYLNMRYRYLPYTYTLAYENATSGLPLARPVNFYGNGDAGCIDQYLWGKDLLVAPVLENTNSRRVVFPEGNWIDMNNYGNRYRGGDEIICDAPLDYLPHFAREGAFITRFAQTTFTNTRDIDFSSYDVLHFPDYYNRWHKTSGYFFDDDRTSTTTLADEAWRITRFEGCACDDAYTIDIATEGRGYGGMLKKRSFMFTIPGYTGVLHHVEKQSGDSDAGVYLSATHSLDALKNSADDAYYIDDAADMLYVKTIVDATPQKLILSNKAGGVDDNFGSATDISLVYSSANAIFSYTLPCEVAGGKIEMYSLAGVKTAEMPLTETSAGTHRLLYTAPSRGVFLARLSVVFAGGATRQINVKMVAAQCGN